MCIFYYIGTYMKCLLNIRHQINNVELVTVCSQPVDKRSRPRIVCLSSFKFYIISSLLFITILLFKTLCN